MLTAAKGVACCDVVIRGAAYNEGRVFFNTLDNQTVAVDAETGKEIWRVRPGDINEGESMTMAPLVVRNKVYVGNSGGEFGARGWITGRIVWRGYSTGPDKDVLIGADFKPVYEQDRGKDLGVSTWPPGAWKTGGGTVWGWISYDADLNLIDHGTGNPGPWNPEMRPGDNKWTTAILARHADTGSVKWSCQLSPHDQYDYDGINENLLLDLPIGGQKRKVLVRPNEVPEKRTGFAMDRYFKAVHAPTGEVLWQFRAGSGIIGQPVTYNAPDGKQYVAVFSGVGGWSGAVVAGSLDPRDPLSALGFVGTMTDLPQHTSRGGTLYVFGL